MKIKVVQYGLGPIGNLITKYLVERNTFEIVGAIDNDPAKIGKDIGLLAGLNPIGINVTDNVEDLLLKTKTHIVVLTTSSDLEKVKPQILEIVSNGINIVSTCEELVYPWITNPQIAGEIDNAAKLNNVSVLSTGVNPGFLMDFLPLSLTSVCRNIDKINVERIQDAQYRRIPFQKKIGAGLSIEHFNEKIKDGSLRHVGLTESIHMIAARLGWNLERTDESICPVIVNKTININGLEISKGLASGVLQTASGFMSGEEKIKLLFKASICEADPHDSIDIEGTPTVSLKIKNGINGDIATCAITVNAIPVVIKAEPGLRTMADIKTVTYFS